MDEKMLKKKGRPETQTHITITQMKAAVWFTMANTVSLFHLTEMYMQFFNHVIKTNLSVWMKEKAGDEKWWMDTNVFAIRE